MHSIVLRTALTSAIASLMFFSVGALAHGDTSHKAGPVVFEQVDWGIAGQPNAVRRSIAIKMLDTMRFTPDRLQVKRGETVRLVISNEGQVLHEFVLGTPKELDAHAALMLRFPNMVHEAPYMAHVPPGKSAEVIWTFNRAGEFDFACMIAGHYQAGMVGKVSVLP